MESKSIALQGRSSERGTERGAPNSFQMAATPTSDVFGNGMTKEWRDKTLAFLLLDSTNKFNSTSHMQLHDEARANGNKRHS